MEMKRVLLIIALSCLVSSPLYADTIILKNGRTIEGAIVQDDEHRIKFEEHFGSGVVTTEYSRDEIEKIIKDEVPTQKIIQKQKEKPKKRETKKDDQGAFEMPENFERQKDLAMWMTHYYLHRDPTLVIPAFKATFEYGVFDIFDDAAMFVTYFFSSVFQQNQDKLEQWYIEADDLLLEEKYRLWTALAFPKYPGGQALLKKLQESSTPEKKETITAFLDSPDQDLLQEKVEHSSSLEGLWGVFFATGDERYIQRIISFLAVDPEDSENPDEANIARAAKAHLIKDASRHQKILDICKKEQQIQTGRIKEALEEIIKKAEEGPARGLCVLRYWWTSIPEGYELSEDMSFDAEKEMARLSSPEASERNEAVRILGYFRCREAVPLLIEFLKDDDQYVRRDAIEALGEIGDPRAIEPLIKAYNRENEIELRKVLSRIKDNRVVDLLIDMLDDEDPEVRSFAIKVLGERQESGATELIITFLQDEDSGVRMNAAYALARIADPASEKPLLDHLANEDDSFVRSAITSALEEIRNRNLITL